MKKTMGQLVVLLFLALSLTSNSAHAGKCGAFVVYDDGVYFTYPDYPKRDYRAWAWNYPSPEEARAAARKECQKYWFQDKPNLATPKGRDNRDHFICRNPSWVFCTDKEDLAGWGVDPEAVNPCGALAVGDIDTYWGRVKRVNQHYEVGWGKTKGEAEVDALHRCRRARPDPQGTRNCRMVAAVCNTN